MAQTTIGTSNGLNSGLECTMISLPIGDMLSGTKGGGTSHSFPKMWAKKESNQFGPSMLVSENTHLLHKGKYHCMDDLQFDWFGFDQTCKSTFSNQLNQIQ